MSGEFEAMADVATGTIVAQAVEGQAAAGQAADHGAEHGHCLNCGTALLGAHCHRCGQPAHIHRTASGLLHDIAHGVLHFEGRTWHTLPLLFWRPGEVTRRYIAGERVNFVSPLALFLFSVFLMVAVFAAIGGPFAAPGADDPVRVAKARTEAAQELASARERIAALEADRTTLLARGEATAAIDEKLVELRAETAALGLVASGKRPPSGGVNSFDLDVNTGVPTLDELLRHAARNPELTLYKLQASAYKFSWALIPISLPFIWLLFAFRRDVGLYDHAVFATYSLAAMTLMVIALALASALGAPGGLIALVLVCFPPWHMYRQLKGAYGLGRLGALWRTVALIISAYTAALIFFLFLLAMGA